MLGRHVILDLGKSVQRRVVVFRRRHDAGHRRTNDERRQLDANKVRKSFVSGPWPSHKGTKDTRQTVAMVRVTPMAYRSLPAAPRAFVPLCEVIRRETGAAVQPRPIGNIKWFAQQRPRQSSRSLHGAGAA